MARTRPPPAPDAPPLPLLAPVIGLELYLARDGERPRRSVEGDIGCDNGPERIAARAILDVEDVAGVGADLEALVGRSPNEARVHQFEAILIEDRVHDLEQLV